MDFFWRIYEELNRVIGKLPGGQKILAGVLLAVLGLVVEPFDRRGYVWGLFLALGILVSLLGVYELVMAWGNKILDDAVSD